MNYYCPQCGEDNETFYEGYCKECRDRNQLELDAHNTYFDYWNALSDTERERIIKDAH